MLSPLFQLRRAVMHGNNDGLADSSSKTKGTDRGKGIKDKPNGSFRGNHVFSSTSSLQPVGTIDRYARYQGIHHPTVSCCYGMLCRICSAVFQPKNRYLVRRSCTFATSTRQHELRYYCCTDQGYTCSEICRL